MNYNEISYYTATILEWKMLLKEDYYKDIIIDSLKFLVEEKRIKVYAFVIMPNHIHLIWKINDELNTSDVQRDFMKYTAQQMKFILRKSNPAFLEEFIVNAKDRIYQIWERNPLSIQIDNEKLLVQKLNYIHCNPLQDNWKLAEDILSYKYSSARFYYEGVDDWGFLTNYGSSE